MITVQALEECGPLQNTQIVLFLSAWPVGRLDCPRVPVWKEAVGIDVGRLLVTVTPTVKACLKHLEFP